MRETISLYFMFELIQTHFHDTDTTLHAHSNCLKETHTSLIFG